MTDKPSHSLPATMRALVCEGVGQPLILKHVPTPEALPGSVVVKVLAAGADANTPRILSGQVGFTFPLPFIPGTRSIGRVAAIGPDTTSLSLGQLVLLEPYIRGRDNPDVTILWGAWDGYSPESKKLMADNWRNAAYAEYVRAPLENCWALNGKILCGSPAEGHLGYTIPELISLTALIIPYGGLRSIDLKAGETVIVSPATGGVSGAAVATAVAMGANVIAVSRNLEVMKKLQATFPRLKIVQLKGNVEEDTAAISQFGPVDAYIDISPPAASASTHVRSCLMALKRYGRACLMGTIGNDIAIPYVVAVSKNLTIRGMHMYERADVRALIKMAESGVLKLGKAGGREVVAQFKLDEVEKAFEAAAATHEPGQMVVLTP